MRRLLLPFSLFSAALFIAALWFFLDPRLPAIASGFDRDASGAHEKHEAGMRLRAAFAQVDRDDSGAVDGVEFRRWLLASWLSEPRGPFRFRLRRSASRTQSCGSG